MSESNPHPETPRAGRVLCKCCFGEINAQGFSVHGGQRIADMLQSSIDKAKAAPSSVSTSPEENTEADDDYFKFGSRYPGQ